MFFKDLGEFCVDGRTILIYPSSPADRRVVCVFPHKEFEKRWAENQKAHADWEREVNS